MTTKWGAVYDSRRFLRPLEYMCGAGGHYSLFGYKGTLRESFRVLATRSHNETLRGFGIVGLGTASSDFYRFNA